MSEPTHAASTDEPTAAPIALPSAPTLARRSAWIIASAFLVLACAYYAETWYTATYVRNAGGAMVAGATAQLIAEDIRLHIARDPITSKEPVSVRVNGNTLEMSGTCSSAAARTLIRNYASARVQNQLTVVDNLSTAPSPRARHRSTPVSR